MSRACVRCGLPRQRHPISRYAPKTGDVSYCLNYMEPAPLWMRVAAVRVDGLVRALRRRG